MKPVLATMAAVCLLAAPGCRLGPPPIVYFLTEGAIVRAGSPVTLSARAADVGNDSVRVRFDWGDGDTSDWSPFFARTDTLVMTHAWGDPGRFAVLVQARSRGGTTSDWFGGVAVTVLDSALVRWMVPIDADDHTAPAVGPDGTIYVNYYGELLALRADGTEKWRRSFPGEVEMPVVAEDGTIYLVSGRLHALHPDGSTRWTDSVRTGYSTAPALGPDGTVYCAHSDTAIAMNADLTRRWAATLPGIAVHCPTVGTDSSVCFSFYSPPGVVAFRPDGTKKWQNDEAYGASTARPDAGFFITGEDIWALDSTGAALWSVSTYHVASEPSVVDGEYVCLACGSGLLLLGMDGSERESWPGPGGSNVFTPTVDELRSLCYLDAGRVTSRWLDSGAVSRWHLVELEGDVSQAALTRDSMLYVVVGDTCLLAIRNGAAPAPGPWSQFRHDARHTGCAAISGDRR